MKLKSSAAFTDSESSNYVYRFKGKDYENVANSYDLAGNLKEEKLAVHQNGGEVFFTKSDFTVSNI